MNIRHNYLEKGEGFPLVLLHGNGEDSGYFEHQIEYFSKDYRVIALDTRGHGKTARGEAEFTLVQFAEDLKMFLDAMKITKAIVLGFSDGGNIALLFALKYQRYVKALVVNGANLYPSGLKIIAQVAIRAEYGLAILVAYFRKQASANAELLRLMTHEPNIVPEMLATITIPVLVIVGSRDIIRRAHTEEIYQSLPNAKLSIIDGNHFIAAKKYKEFNEIVDKFLKLSDNIW